MKLAFLPGNIVRTVQSRGARVVVMKLPCHDRAVFASPAANIDYPARPEVRPREFFLPRPRYLHWLARSLRQASSLDRGFPGVLSTVAGPGIGHDHAHNRRGQNK